MFTAKSQAAFAATCYIRSRQCKTHSKASLDTCGRPSASNCTAALGSTPNKITGVQLHASRTLTRAQKHPPLLPYARLHCKSAHLHIWVPVHTLFSAGCLGQRRYYYKARGTSHSLAKPAAEQRSHSSCQTLVVTLFTSTLAPP